MKKTLVFLLTVLWCSASAAQDQIPAYDWANFQRYAAGNATAGTAPLGVIMGDSIAEGWFLADSAFFARNRLIGRGISGQVTAQMLVRFRRDVLDLKPKYVVIIGGINDIARNQGYISQENTLGNLASMCELALLHGIEPILTTLMPANRFFWRTNLPDTREQIGAMNEKIRAYARENGFRLIDIEVLMADENGITQTSLSNDSVHPTLAGYKVFEQALLPQLINH